MPQSHFNLQQCPEFSNTLPENHCLDQQQQQPQPNILVQIPMRSSSNAHNNANDGHHQRPQFTNNQRMPRASNGNEIKSEPIKFENEPTSNRTSPFATTSNIHIRSSIETRCNNQNIADNNNALQVIDTSSLVTARPKNIAIKCLRCNICPFVSISPTALSEHITSQHQSDAAPKRKKIACPGCENVFYSRNSLQTHLSNDHEMTTTDIRVVLQSVFEGTDETDGMVATSSGSTSAPGSAGKQKIYLKKVEVLINPSHSFVTPLSAAADNNDPQPSQSFDTSNLNALYDHDFDEHQDLAIPIEDYQDPHDFIDLIDDEEFDECTENIHPTIDCFQNKIFVKDDHSLRNPVQYFSSHILDFPTPNNTSPQFAINQFNGGKILHAESSHHIPTFQQQQPTTSEQIFLEKFAAGNHQPDTSRRPSKIYIKNVDILTKPMFVRSNANHSLSPQPAFVQSFSGTPFSNHTPFTFHPNQLPNSTPPTPNTNQHKKIYIKNIDILKEPATAFHPSPSFTPSPVLCPPHKFASSDVRTRNTLHLRTVDELNLMNINEVQNLIENFQEEPAENLHQSLTNSDYADGNCLDSVLHDLDVVDYAEDSMKKLTFPIRTIHSSSEPKQSFSDRYHDADHEFPGMDTQSTSSSNKVEPTAWSDWNDTLSMQNQHYQNTTATPSSSASTFIDYEKTYDKDILFVCAQEIINSSDSAVDQHVADQQEPTLLYAERDDVDVFPTPSPAATPTADPAGAVEQETTTATGPEITRDSSQTKGRIYVVGNLMKNSTTDAETLQIADSPELVDDVPVGQTDVGHEEIAPQNVPNAAKAAKRTKGSSKRGKLFTVFRYQEIIEIHFIKKKNVFFVKTVL